MKKLALIGCGNMGQAILSGVLNTRWAQGSEIAVHSHGQGWQDRVRIDFGVNVAGSNAEAAQGAEVVVLAVKPNSYQDVLQELRPVIQGDQIVCGIAPAYSLANLRRQLASDQGWIARAMPNTPALVGAGITGYCFEAAMPPDRQDLARSFLEAFGQAIEVEEDLMAAVGSVSGSAPAFIYMVIEAMTQGGIGLGLTASQAQAFATATVAGAAKMVQETGSHPAQLRDAVSSAGGTTIAGVNHLEKKAFKGALIEAMEASAQRFRDMEDEASQA